MKDLVLQTWNALSRRCDDERGVALIVAAGSMVALTSAVALAIDVGMLTVARTEAQSAADGAALAGASGLITSPHVDILARARATEYAGRNDIRGQTALVQPEDITVDLDARTVTVRVLRTETRGNAVGTFFARIFGVTSVDITTDATARASFAGGVNCLLPLAIPDKWLEAGGAGNDPNEFNPELGDEYIPWMDASTDPPTYNTQTFTGYSEDDIGTQIVLTSNNPNDAYQPSWYYAWRPPDQQGAEDFEENIQGCVDPTITYFVGQTVITEEGNQVGKTRSGFENLISQDPGAVWNDNLECVTDSAHEFELGDGSVCRNSPRIRPIPLFDPSDGPDSGAKPFDLQNFAGIFVEGMEGQQVTARFIGYQGLEPASDPDQTAGPQFKVVQLIE